MSTPTHKPTAEPEIDLGTISRGIGKGVSSISRGFYRMIRFVIKNIIILGILFIVGAALGFYLDRQTKVYDHEVIVSPNFGSVDYLYSKINLINYKIKERDTLFLKSIGIKKPKKFLQIDIEPVVDVYRFVTNNENNFKVLELMAEDADFNQVVEETPTSKNYTFHEITFTTAGKTAPEMTLKPLLDYLNNNAFFKQRQKAYVYNVTSKIKTNETLIAQIDAILDGYARNSAGAGGSGNVYNSESSQLNDVIKTKDELIEEQGYHRVELISMDKIVKESSYVLNMKNTKSLNGKMKYVLPIVFMLLFALFYSFRKFYKNQSQRYLAENNS